MGKLCFYSFIELMRIAAMMMKTLTFSLTLVICCEERKDF